MDISTNNRSWQRNAGIPPLFRWAGSKRKLIPKLLEYVPEKFSKYVEPFCGSACLFFALSPKKAILSDINSELINAYLMVQSSHSTIAEEVGKLPVNIEFYKNIRSLDPVILEPIERAVRFTYLNRYCFNGVYRTNRQGGFNVPMGKKTGPMPDKDHFLNCNLALQHATIVAGDFDKTLKLIRKNDFVYLDPPYAKSHGRDRGEYGADSFSFNDIPRLSKYLDAIHAKGATFLLSYAAEESAEQQLSSRWSVERVAVRRHVAGFSGARKMVNEILVSNRK